jgi:proliferating cell nuclear antigen
LLQPVGMSLQAMDGSHVALVSLNLSMEGFEHYRADTNMVLGINIALLAKVMKLADPEDSITLSAEDTATHLKLVFENPKTERTTEFTMNLIQLDIEHLAIPETEYSSVVSLNSSEFTKICKELYSLNETISIATDPEFVQFSVESEAGSGSIKIGANESGDKGDQTSIEVQTAVNQQFAIRYLNMFNKASPLSTYTRLCLHEEQPLVVEYKIDQLGVLKYYLAPKINDE